LKVKGNTYKNKRVLVESIHYLKAEQNRENMLTEQADARRRKNKLKRGRIAAKNARIARASVVEKFKPGKVCVGWAPPDARGSQALRRRQRQLCRRRSRRRKVSAAGVEWTELCVDARARHAAAAKAAGGAGGKAADAKKADAKKADGAAKPDAKADAKPAKAADAGAKKGKVAAAAADVKPAKAAEGKTAADAKPAAAASAPAPKKADKPAAGGAAAAQPKAAAAKVCAHLRAHWRARVCWRCIRAT
jgi:hypothetical protein